MKVILELWFVVFLCYVSYHAGHYRAAIANYKASYNVGYDDGVQAGLDWEKMQKDLPCMQP